MKLRLWFAIILVALLAACVRPPRPLIQTSGQVDLTQLWRNPVDLEGRDLFYGAGGAALAPRPETQFVYVRENKGGFSPGFDATGPDGAKWSVKLGSEAQTEVVSSRIMWALGYYQPPVYYLASWRMTGGPANATRNGRFRPSLPNERVVSEWSWRENPFTSTQPFKGLLVINLLLSNWDWKTSNNKVYEVDSLEGPRRIFIVRDLGASFGRMHYSPVFKLIHLRLAQGSRNRIEDFERQGFVKEAAGERVDFDYSGIHGDLVKSLSRRDVVWACTLMSRLSQEQLRDAFRAAGYAPDVADRFIVKLRSKIAQGVALGPG